MSKQYFVDLGDRLLDAVDSVVIVHSEYKRFSLEVNVFFVLMCLFWDFCGGEKCQNTS